MKFNWKYMLSLIIVLFVVNESSLQIETVYLIISGPKHPYYNILAEYDRVWLDENYTIEKWENVYDITSEYRYSETVQYTLNYCIEDLMNDGIPELIIGVGEEGKECKPFILYAYDNGKVTEVIGRERYFMEIYQNGIIELYGGGGLYTYYMYYQLQEKTDDLEYIEKLTEERSNEGKIYFFKGKDGDEAQITEKEFEKYKSKYTSKSVKLEWRKLEGFWNSEDINGEDEERSYSMEWNNTEREDSYNLKISEHEMNVILEMLDVREWYVPPYAQDEMDLPVDEPLGSYSEEILKQYIENYTKIEVEIEYYLGRHRIDETEERFPIQVIKSI